MSGVLLSGFFVGLIYGLFALGLVITYKGTRVINFAHGETGMIGAFMFTVLWVEQGWNPVVSIVCGVALSAAVAALIQVLVARTIGHHSPFTSMIGTFAIAAVLLEIAHETWGAEVRLQPPLISGDGVQVLGLGITPQQLLVLGASVVVMALLTVLYSRSFVGLVFRANASSPTASQVVGVNVNLASLATWALSGALAGLAGILVSPLLRFSVAFMTPLLIRGLAAALIAGLRSIPVVMAAGIGIGVLEAWLQFEYAVAGLPEVLVAAAVIALLVARPAGLARKAAALR